MDKHEQIPNVLTGLLRLTDLLTEMPMPTPLPRLMNDSKALLYHPRLVEEAHKLLNNRSDDRLVQQLVNSLSQTSGDCIQLKDNVDCHDAKRPKNPELIPELLEAILENNPDVFNGPRTVSCDYLTNKTSVELAPTQTLKTETANAVNPKNSAKETSPTPSTSSKECNNNNNNAANTTNSAKETSPTPSTSSKECNNNNAANTTNSAKEISPTPSTETAIVVKLTNLAKETSPTPSTETANAVNPTNATKETCPTPLTLSNECNNNNNNNSNAVNSTNLAKETAPTPPTETANAVNPTNAAKETSPTPSTETAIAVNSMNLAKETASTPPTETANAVNPTNLAKETSSTPSTETANAVNSTNAAKETSPTLSTSSKECNNNAVNPTNLAKEKFPTPSTETANAVNSMNLAKETASTPPTETANAVNSTNLAKETSPTCSNNNKNNEDARRRKRKRPLSSSSSSSSTPIGSKTKRPFGERTGFAGLVRSILESIDENVITNAHPHDAILSRDRLRNLQAEAAKLKALEAMTAVPPDKLCRLLIVLDINVHNAAVSNPDDDDVIGTMDACLTCLYVLTTPNLPKKMYLEDIVENVILFLKDQLENKVFPDYESTAARNKTENVRRLYDKILEIVRLLTEMAEMQNVSHFMVLRMSRLAIRPFFVERVDELQLCCLDLVTTLFTKREKCRNVILNDVLSSLADAPSDKRRSGKYKLLDGGGSSSIQTLTALVLQLVQCATIIEKKNGGGGGGGGGGGCKAYDLATETAGVFVTLFLNKSVCKTDRIIYGPLFENFLNDLLATVNRPEWPASELLLSVLAAVLVVNFSSKTCDHSLKVASLGHMGTVAAKMRIEYRPDPGDRQNEIVDRLIADASAANGPSENERDSDPDDAGTAFLRSVLLDYLADKMRSKRDRKLLQNAKRFYVAQWCSDEAESAIEEERVYSNYRRIAVRCKEIVDSENLFVDHDDDDDDDYDYENGYGRRRTKAAVEIDRRRTVYVDDETATAIARRLASKRSYFSCFRRYLKQILLVLREPSVQVRGKAFKCLVSIAEADASVLEVEEAQTVVGHSLLDRSAFVRESAVDLIGKCAARRPRLADEYYDAFSIRILDTAVSVRKRVVRVLGDILLRRRPSPKTTDIYAKLLGRMNDEEMTVRETVKAVFEELLFGAGSDSAQLVTDVADAVAVMNDPTLEQFEGLLRALFGPKRVTAFEGIARRLIDDALRIEESEKQHGVDAVSRFFGHFTAVYLLTKVDPRLTVAYAGTLQPYLSVRCRNKDDFRVVSRVANILEMVVPIIRHPGKKFLAQIENDFVKLMVQHDRLVISSSVSCLGVIINYLTRNFKLIRDCFETYFSNLTSYETLSKTNPNDNRLASYKPWLKRAIYAIGLLLRHFDFSDRDLLGDGLLSPDTNDIVFETFLRFLRHDDEDIRNDALKAIGFACVRRCDYFFNDELKVFYRTNLNDRDLSFKTKQDVLGNFELFLGEQLVKEVNDDDNNDKRRSFLFVASSSATATGMASAVVQLYLKDILATLLNRESSVRHSLLKVVRLVLRLGIVHPTQLVPCLVAMSTDREDSIVDGAIKSLRDIECRYPGFVHAKVSSGLKLSFELQSMLRSDSKKVARGLRPLTSLRQAVIGPVYSLIADSKRHRRTFALDCLGQFDESVSVDLPYLLYLTDNLAYLPYSVQDEPLFVVHQIDVAISVSGANLLQSFGESIEANADATEIESCATAAQGFLLLLALRRHLKYAYRLTNAKINGFSPMATGKAYEKAVSVKCGSEFEPKAIVDRLSRPASAPMPDDEKRKLLVAQYLRFKQLMLKVDSDDDDDDDDDDLDSDDDTADSDVPLARIALPPKLLRPRNGNGRPVVANRRQNKKKKRLDEDPDYVLP